MVGCGGLPTGIPDRRAFAVRDACNIRSGGGDEVVGDEQGGFAGGKVANIGGGCLPFGRGEAVVESLPGVEAQYCN